MLFVYKSDFICLYINLILPTFMLILSRLAVNVFPSTSAVCMAFLLCAVFEKNVIECCTVSVHYAYIALSFRYFATMYYVFCIFIRICFIALCNICRPMSENSSVELMFMFIRNRR